MREFTDQTCWNGCIATSNDRSKFIRFKLNGSETFDIGNIEEIISKPGKEITIVINYKNHKKKINVLSRIDTEKK